MRNSSGNPAGTATFKPMRIGGGGAQTQLYMSATGATKITASDVYNFYVKTTGEWFPAFTSASLPTGQYFGSSGFTHGGQNSWGCYACAVAPNDGTRLYGVWNSKLFVSSDTATSWTATAVPSTTMDPNSQARGTKLTVDPGNKDAFLFGTTSDGVYGSTNAGTSVTKVLTGTGPFLVACDGTSTVTSSTHQRWMAFKPGSGIYLSTTGPTGTFTLMSGSPTAVSNLIIDASGKAWAATGASTGGSLWTQSGAGSWTQMTGSPNGLTIVTVDPANTAHVIALDDNGVMNCSADTGSTWVGFGNSSHVVMAQTFPWWNFGAGAFAPGMACFNPAGTNELWLSTGLGVISTTPKYTFSPPINWTEQTAGIESFVGRQVVTPPGTNGFVVTLEDKAIWTFTNGNDGRPLGWFCPSGTREIRYGHGIDFAPATPTFLAAIVGGDSDNGYSLDGGRSWTAYPTAPAGWNEGGSVLALTTNDQIFFPDNNGRPYYTHDRGATWSYVTFTGLPTSGENGFGFSKFFDRVSACQDKTNGNAYAYNYGPTGNTGIAGVWRSTDKGDTWTHVYTGHITTADGFHAKLRHVYGQTGHFFFTAGRDQGMNLMRSTDGCVTWSAVTNMTDIHDIGIGKAAAGKSYPSIYVYGKLSGVRGLYRSDDNCTTRVLLANSPGGNIDTIVSVYGDLNAYGRGYLMTTGSTGLVFDYGYNLRLTP